MSIEYIIGDACPVKEALSLGGLLGMIRQRSTAVAAAKTLEKQGKSREEILETTIKLNRVLPGGKVETTEQTVAALFEETMQLDELEQHCRECALAFGRGFGCYHCIQLPISAKAEAWLMGLAKASLAKNDQLSKAAVNHIIKFKVSGEKFKIMRSDESGAYLEAKQAQELVYDKKLFVKRKISTDQLLEILFGDQVIERAQQIALLHFTGCFRILDTAPAENENSKIIQIKHPDGKVYWYAFDLWPGKNDDASTIQLIEYFDAIFLAFCAGQNIYLDF